MMMSNPGLDCFSARHVWFMLIAAAALIFFSIGVPYKFYRLVTDGTRKGLLVDRRYQSRYGWIWEPYAPEFRTYEVSMLARRFIFSAILTFVWRAPLAQAAVSIMVFVALIGFENEPFLNPLVGYIDKLGLIFLTFWSLGGMLFFVYTGKQQHLGISTRRYSTEMLYTEAALVIVFVRRVYFRDLCCELLE